MNYIIMAFIIICGILDFKTRTIPNKITFPLIILCLIYQIIQGHFILSLVGLAISFVIGLICFALNGMGGGDVKLMAAMGAYLGTYSFLSVLFIASILGVIWGFSLYLKKKMFIKKIKEIFSKLLLVYFKALKITDFVEADNTKNKQYLTIPFGTCLSLALIYINFNPVSIF